MSDRRVGVPHLRIAEGARRLQEADTAGQVTFTSIFPAAYSGRWPHIHFEVYQSVDDATTAPGILATSQIALPEDACNAVSATEGYDQSVRNMGQTQSRRTTCSATTERNASSRQSRVTSAAASASD